MKRSKVFRRFVLYPFLILWACVTALTGTPTPGWRLEKLNSPVAVKSIAFLAPENLDESQTPAPVIAEIQEYHRHFASDFRPRRYNEGRINGYDLQRMYAIESDLKNAARRQPKPQERLQWTFPAANAFGD